VGSVQYIIVDLIKYVERVRHRQHGTMKNGQPLSLRRVSVLDVGGGSGKKYERAISAMTNYTSLDFVTAAHKSVGQAGSVASIVGNIQRCNPQITSGSFDVVMALNVFEHLLGPFEAAKEMTRIVADGGLLVVMVPFAQRYHAYPIDTLRYTHTMLRYLFEKNGGVRTLFAGYAEEHSAVNQPFHNGKYGHFKDFSDEPMTLDLGKNHDIRTLWIGRRDSKATFAPESLDRNTDFFGSSIVSALP